MIEGFRGKEMLWVCLRVSARLGPLVDLGNFLHKEHKEPPQVATLNKSSFATCRPIFVVEDVALVGVDLHKSTCDKAICQPRADGQVARAC